MGVESLGDYWNWHIFLIGLISVFALKFLEHYSKIRKDKENKSFLRVWKLDDYVYLILGGLFTVVMQPTNLIHAIIFGATWESLFVRLIKGATKKEEDSNEK